MTDISGEVKINLLDKKNNNMDLYLSSNLLEDKIAQKKSNGSGRKKQDSLIWTNDTPSYSFELLSKTMETDSTRYL